MLRVVLFDAPPAEGKLLIGERFLTQQPRFKGKQLPGLSSRDPAFFFFFFTDSKRLANRVSHVAKRAREAAASSPFQQMNTKHRWQ